MSAWAFCSEEQVREVFLLCRRGIWGASGEASRKTPACSFKIFFGGKRDRYQPIEKPEHPALCVLNGFRQASREGLAARCGIALRKVTQRALRDLKFCCATLQANE